MKNLQIIANNFTPAKVDFNYEEIANRLDVILDKYKGLIFTEETVADCKKTMAELRKGQKSLDDFRKETKKKLTLSVTDFEDDCKTLYKKFDEVIDPLKQQSDYFETTRRENKKIEVEGIIDNIIEQYELSEKYSKDLIVQDSYLIASISIKKVTEELEHQTRLLRDKQDEEELDIEFITNKIHDYNKYDELNLLPITYTRLIEVMDMRTILTKMDDDVGELLKMKEIEKARLEQLEVEILVREAELENKRIAQEEEDKRLEEMVDIEISGMEEIIQATINHMDFTELPQEPQKIHKIYNVLGNTEQLKDLEIFLNAREIEWEVI